MNKVIFADFNNRDVDGYIRLNTIGTINDLAECGIKLEAGAPMTVSDGDLTADVVVRAPGPEGVWRAEIVSELFDSSEALS